MRILSILFLVFITNVISADITMGNVKGNVTLVEYFDYNCPICRGFAPTIPTLLANNPDLKIIQRVVPVLAPSSSVVDSLVLASYFQNKFKQTESSVLAINAREAIPFPMLFNAIKPLGLNIIKLNHDMQGHAIQHELRHNLMLYRRLDIHQIPVIIIYRSDMPRQKITFVGSQTAITLNNAINSIQYKETP